MSGLAVFPNLEMGDNLVCNGLCRVLAQRERLVLWNARATYALDIRQMFSDLPNVQVVDAYDYPEARARVPYHKRTSLMGYFVDDGTDWRTCQWDQEFYRQAGVDFDERWKSFDLPPSLKPQKEILRAETALIHEIPSRGFNIRRDLLPSHISTTVITRAHSFWDWLPAIYCAAELHFVDSSYLNLAESLWALGYLRTTKLVFHSYAKKQVHNSVPPILRAPWIIL